MFNRQKFNRGKFNRSTGTANSVFFHGQVNIATTSMAKLTASRDFSGSMVIDTSTKGQLNRTAPMQGHASIATDAKATITRSRHVDGMADILLGMHGNIIRAKHLQGKLTLIITAANLISFNTFRYETINLQGLNFRPGEEIIIDSDNMTVTLNGQNAMEFLDRYSDFFEFNPGGNQVTFEAAPANTQVDLRILWKDRWR